MTNNPIEEFLAWFTISEKLGVPVSEAEKKLVSLVRIYRDANKYFVDGAIPNIAEEKALEIVK